MLFCQKKHNCKIVKKVVCFKKNSIFSIKRKYNDKKIFENICGLTYKYIDCLKQKPQFHFDDILSSVTSKKRTFAENDSPTMANSEYIIYLSPFTEMHLSSCLCAPTFIM